MRRNEAIGVCASRANVSGAPRRPCTFALEGALHHALDAAQDGRRGRR